MAKRRVNKKLYRRHEKTFEALGKVLRRHPTAGPTNPEIARAIKRHQKAFASYLKGAK